MSGGPCHHTPESDPLHVPGLPTVLPHPPLTRLPRGRIAEALDAKYHIQVRGVRLRPCEPAIHLQPLPVISSLQPLPVDSRRSGPPSASQWIEQTGVLLLSENIPVHQIVLGPPPLWLFPPRHPESPAENTEGDILSEPFTPEKVLGQPRRTKRSAPGVDGITYSDWRWVDPLCSILAAIFNTCRLNRKIPTT